MENLSYLIISKLIRMLLFKLTKQFYPISGKRQVSVVRCPGDTIHSGYQEYIRLILLLSKRQITDEEIKRSESWTPYRL